MINLHVFWDFDFRPIFGGFLKGLGTSKLVIFSLFSHFLPCKFRSLFSDGKKSGKKKSTVILGPFGGPCGPGKQSLELGFKRKSLSHVESIRRR